MNALPPAVIWAAVFVDELVRSGVQKAVVAPGSRSTPLALAIAAHPGIEALSLLDERAAGFFALGIGAASGVPAALVCTSGTAGANFYPALIEAAQAHVPLLVLTADRPHELRGSGANQTIDQVRLFGSFPRWYQDMPLPEADPEPRTLRFLRTSADRAFAAAVGPLAGPVHINFPFRKPFQADPGAALPFEAGRLDDSGSRPLATIESGPALRAGIYHPLPPRTLIVAGPGCPAGDFPQALADFSRKTGYPILADGLSGLRFGPWAADTAILNPQACRGAEPADLVLQFGAVPTAPVLASYFENLPAQASRISIQAGGSWHDDVHTLRRVIRADPAGYCRMLLQSAAEHQVDPAWLAGLQSADHAYLRSIGESTEQNWLEGMYLQAVIEALPEGSLLFVGNSNPVRHLEELVAPREKRIRVFGNRGASGIDGNLSTAFGIAAALGRPITVVCGDLAFFHDLNALLALQRLGIRATIVLINNNGGGIFHRLPVSNHEPAFTDLFLTPHHLHFEGAGRLFDVDFQRLADPQSFRPNFEAALLGGGSTILECPSDSRAHEAARREILARYEKWLQTKETK